MQTNASAMSGVKDQRLDVSRALQTAVLETMDGSGLPREVQLAIAFNLVTDLIIRTWPPGYPRGKLINRMADEFKGRLQKFLPPINVAKAPRPSIPAPVATPTPARDVSYNSVLESLKRKGLTTAKK